MEPSELLPKRVVKYIHEMGVRALDHLAATPGEIPGSLGTLLDDWRSMPVSLKREFVDYVATAVIEVVAASAVLPPGLRRGKKVAKATRKVLKRETKKLRKLAEETAGDKRKKKSAAKPKARSGKETTDAKALGKRTRSKEAASSRKASARPRRTAKPTPAASAPVPKATAPAVSSASGNR